MQRNQLRSNPEQLRSTSRLLSFLSEWADSTHVTFAQATVVSSSKAASQIGNDCYCIDWETFTLINATRSWFQTATFRIVTTTETCKQIQQLQLQLQLQWFRKKRVAKDKFSKTAVLGPAPLPNNEQYRVFHVHALET